MLPTWNLNDLYSSISDKKITADLNWIKLESKKFKREFHTKIPKLSADRLAGAIEKYEKIGERAGKLGSYAYLLYASDLSDQKILEFYQNLTDQLSETESELVFFTLELNQIDEKKLKYTKKLLHYKPFIRDCRRFKKHQLSHELENFSVQKDVSGRKAWVRLFDETVNNLKFAYQDQTLNSQQVFNLLSDPDQQTRQTAAKAIEKTLGENAKTFGYITNVLAKDKEVDDRFRKFKTPISSRNLGNDIEDEVVEVMIKKVKQNYKKISHRYYTLKAKMLGFDKLNYWDRNAPLAPLEELINFDEAKQLVLSAYREFSPTMAEIAQKFFDQKWIDAEVRTGKESGAFSHPTVPSAHPYILMNYQNKVRDVATLAHELGHGVHQYLARDKGFLMSGTPLTLAETASVFGEQLVFQKFLAGITDKKQKIRIIAGKVEDMINTVIRQIAFLEFEKKVHDERKKGEISLKKLGEFWMEVQKESLGPIFKFDEGYQSFWSYIPHFIHSPFYVYSYAFGDCLVNSLYAVYQKGDVKNFEEKYLAMLASGGTKHHKEMLKPFGIKISDPNFWQGGLDVIINYIDEVEKAL